MKFIKSNGPIKKQWRLQWIVTNDIDFIEEIPNEIISYSAFKSPIYAQTIENFGHKENDFLSNIRRFYVELKSIIRLPLYFLN